MSEVLGPAYSGPPVTRREETEAIVLPQLIVAAGPVAVERVLEFFAARIANARPRAAYGRAVGQFLAWCEASASPPSRRSTSPPTSGPTRGRPRPLSSTWRGIG